MTGHDLLKAEQMENPDFENICNSAKQCPATQEKCFVLQSGLFFIKVQMNVVCNRFTIVT